MAFTPDQPFPKSAGNPIRSKDWNDLVNETRRLDTAKVERAGDAITGPLSVAGALAIGKSSAAATAKVDVLGDLRINDSNLFLRGAADVGHGLGWFGPTKPFAATNVDGPVVWGTGGGALGSGTGAAQRIALRWDGTGNVGIGVPSSELKVDIGARMRLRQGPDLSAGFWLHQTGPNADRAFVGMANDNQVGLFGVTVGWGFLMNVVNGDLSVAGEINSPRFRATTLMSARPGALPLANTFTSNGGTLLVYTSGSAFRATGGVMGIQMRIDGVVMAELRAFTNEVQSHKAFPPSFVVVTSTGPGAHTLDLHVSVGGTVTDFNDFFNVMVLELPFR
jgi:hypothetical protein